MIAKSAGKFSVDALVFDAYGTLFDVQSVSMLAERLFPGRIALPEPWQGHYWGTTPTRRLPQARCQR